MDESSLRILSYNIRFGGKGRERLLSRVIESLDPHVVVFQEASDPRVIARLARDLDIAYWGARRKYSLGFLSRLSLSEWRWHKGPRVKNAFLDLRFGEPPLRLIGAHLSPHFSQWGERLRHHEVVSLLRLIRKDEEDGPPPALVGDFNTVASGEELRIDQMPLWMKMFIRISGGPTKPRALKTLQKAGYVDGYCTLYPGKEGYTFPTLSPHIRLDYVFLPSERIHALDECTVVKEPSDVLFASDHFPLLIVLNTGG